jgi:type IX secretion system PorP/SprF family membrane protein
MNQKKLYFFISIHFLANHIFSQDIPFSNTNANAVYLNPASTGVINRDVRIGTIYRSQGKNVANPYNTMGINADLAFYPNRDKSNFIGVGVNGYKHDEGIAKYRQTIFNISVSYTKGLSSTMTDFLTLGFQGGISQRAMNINGLRWDSQWDGTRNSFNETFLGEYYDTKNKDVYDMAAGALFNKKISRNLKFNTGVAVHHVFTPSISMNSSPYGPNKVANDPDFLHRKFTVHGAAEISTTDNSAIILVPAFIYSQKMSQKLLMFGMDLKFLKGNDSKFTDYMKQTAISFGLSYRWGDAIIPHARIDYKDFSFFLAYDVTVSKLNAANKSNGAFEFAFLWNFKTAMSSKNKPRVFKFIQ